MAQKCNKSQNSEDTYLGDIISEDGQNSKNIRNRVAKGVGIITKIMGSLEKITMGEHKVSTALLMRESQFNNGILTNSDVWYGLSKEDVNQLEILDRNLFRQVFATPVSTPTESLYLELGILDIETIIKSRRINYLHYLCTRNESEMLYKFFSTQWRLPTNRKDWTEMVKADLEDFDISADLDLIKAKSADSFKNMVKVKSKEFAWKKFMGDKIDHSKLDNLWYSDLNIQNYLTASKFTAEEARMLFLFRTRMANFEENF